MPHRVRYGMVEFAKLTELRLAAKSHDTQNGLKIKTIRERKSWSGQKKPRYGESETSGHVYIVLAKGMLTDKTHPRPGSETNHECPL